MNESSQLGISSPLSLSQIVGESAALREALQQVATVASTDSTVLIYGETGTGKELIATAIHQLSTRSTRAFVKLNCAAIPPGLLESELFGHEKGAFTGAIARRMGRFELAHDGTMFLDEIGEMALELQPKLLRFLQEREFERVGSSRTLQSNARLVAATNRDLGAMVDDQTFREDVYYRLSVFPIRVPPLRERRADIPLLTRFFVDQFAREMHKEIRSVSSEMMISLEDYDWPGNIRELQNVLERAVILARGPVLDAPLARVGQLKLAPIVAAPSSICDAPVHSLADAMRVHIRNVLESTDWVVAGPNGAAARLGMKRSTLNFRIKKLGIRRARDVEIA